MNKRFSIFEMWICTMVKEGKSYRPNPNYVIRKCVVDEEQSIAIDMEDKLKYDYVKTINGRYFVEKSSEKIELGKKIAVFPVSIILSSDELLVAQSIIEELKSGKDFTDGNKVIYINDYVDSNKNSKQKRIEFRKNKGKK